jgi:hypothetical protein
MTIDSDAPLVGIVETPLVSIFMKPISIFIGFCQTHSSASSRHHSQIQCQSCLMFTRACISTDSRAATSAEHRILKSFASISTDDSKPISAEIMPEMPSHISEHISCLLSKLKFPRVIRREVRINWS